MFAGMAFWSVNDAWAQGTGDGSIYSAFGIGELSRFGSSQVEAMGGGGAAMRSVNYSNFSNPASLGDQVLTRISGGVQFQTITFTDGNNSSRLGQGALNSVQMSFPLIERRLGLGVSLSPYTRVNYRVREMGSLSAPDSVLYGVDSEGRGGLHSIQGAIGYRLSTNVSVGLSAGYLFGIMEDGRRTFFVGSDHWATEVMNGTRLGGLTATLGTQIALPGPLSEIDEIYLGATFTIPTRLSGDRVRTVGTSLDRDTLGVVSSASVDLPWMAEAGVAYRLDSRWYFVIDGAYAPWSTFSSTVPFGGYDPQGPSLMRDQVRVSAGMEVVPGGNDPLAPFLARSSYRLGGYLERAYVDPSDDFNLTTYAVTGGMSLPSFLSGTRLDLNFSVGTRGQAERGLVRDVFYRFSATVNIGERWFEQRKLR